jgi:hypothetical protein
MSDKRYSKIGGPSWDESPIWILDLHVSGRGVVSTIAPRNGGCCLTVDERVERGWCRNERGRWVDPAEVARGVSALHQRR